MESIMASSSSGKRKPKPLAAGGSGSTQPFSPMYLDLDQRCFASPLTGQLVSVEDATDQEFDQFIRQYVEIGWSLEERINALIDAIEDGQKIEFAQPEKLGLTQFPTQFSRRANQPEKPNDIA